jgi:eukaryotic-like serine/threonine-protein kinase
MPDDPRVRQLLEELLDSGSSPGEVCRACPELLTQVRERWRRVRAVGAQVGALFPTPGPASGADATPPAPRPAYAPTPSRPIRTWPTT